MKIEAGPVLHTHGDVGELFLAEQVKPPLLDLVAHTIVAAGLTPGDVLSVTFDGEQDPLVEAYHWTDDGRFVLDDAGDPTTYVTRVDIGRGRP